MKKVYLIIALCFLVVQLKAQTYNGYSNNPVENDGNSETKAIHIYTAGDLIYLSHNNADWEKKYFIQMADIDFGNKENVDWDNDGVANWSTSDQMGFSPIGDMVNQIRFVGHYNGNNKTINNLYINRPNTFYVGLFGATRSYYVPYEIKNIKLINCSINGASYVGGIVGQSESALINCHVEGTVTSTNSAAYIGGIAGQSGILHNSSSSAVVYGSGRVGGLVGDSDEIRNSFFAGIAIGDKDAVGGIAGFFRGPGINCYSSGAVIGRATVSSSRTGGFVGMNKQAVTHCYSSGFVSGEDWVTGGFLGENYTGTVVDSYFDLQTSTQIKKIGMYENNQAPNITALNTSDFKNTTNYFKNWDRNIWSFDTQGRPFLSWQKVAVSNSSVMKNAMVGHVYKNTEVLIVETGVRYAKNVLPLSWNKVSHSGAVMDVSADFASRVDFGETYFAQAYALDNEGNFYYGDMIQFSICKIIYDANGGENGDIVEEIVTGNEKPLMPATPKKTGYRLGGWNTKSDGTGWSVSVASNITTNLYLYAKWIANTYNIIFNSNGGGGTMNKQSILYNETKPLNTIWFYKNGYSFVGWAETPDGNVAYADRANYKMQTADDVTLYAKWSPNSYNIYFMPNGGTGTMPKQAIYFDDTKPLANNLFVKPGYRFIGWSKTPEGEMVYADGANYTMLTASGVNLYAKWELITYQVTFKNDDQIYHTQQTNNYPATILFPTNPVKPGNSFLGWFTSLGPEGVKLTEMTEVTQDLTVYAKWAFATSVINKTQTYSYSISPNPAQNTIWIKGSKHLAGLDVYIYKVNGGVILKNKLNGEDSEIDISMLSSGLYMVKLAGEVHKLVVQ
jgi:uncharacterized repeat protein (TIGR02543 family)